MEGEGMVAVVRGLRDSGLAVTLLDGSRQYTLVPNAIGTSIPRQRSPVANSSVSTQQSPSKKTADSGTEPSFPQCDSGIQAVDGRYASTYRTTHCHVRPTSPPVQLAEFPPQRPDICPGHGNFQVGGTGSGITHPPIKAIAPSNFRGGLSWPDRGSVCSPRPSHEPDAFANSLRKYPNLSPDRSSEVVERLINYTQAKGISRTFPRNQGSPTRLPEPGSHHTFDLKGCPRSSRLYEPEILIRSTKKEEAPTRDKKNEHVELRLRGYDVRCIRDMSKRLRESVKTMSSYPYNQPVCPTIKEINHYDQVHDQSSVNSVNMEIQAAVKMISREVATVQRDKPPGKTVAVPDSPPASADERNAEGDCVLDSSLNTQTSFKSIQTPSCPSDTTLKPRKSAQAVLSSIDFFSKQKRPKSMEGRKSKSQEDIKVTNDDLRRSLLELIDDVSTCTKSKKRIRDELIKKLFDTEITEKEEKKRENEKVKRERCHKYVSTYWPSGCDFVGDFEELLNKLKQWNGGSKTQSDKYNVRNAEYKQLDFVLKDWISSLNINNKDNLDRGDVLHSLEDQIKAVFKDRTKRDFDLKAEVVRIIGEIPIEVNSGYTKTSYLNRLVDALFKRLKSVVINQQNERNKKLLNKSKKIFSKDDVKDFLKTHLTGLFEECNVDICDNVMHALQNDLRDILMDSIDCIRCGHLDDARDEMKIVFQDVGQLTDSQRDYVIKVILQNLQTTLNDNSYIYTYTILHSNVQPNTRNTNGTDITTSGVNEDLNSNLDFYTNQLSIKIHEWLDTLNIPQIKDRGFREVVVNDLAGDIVDRHKYLELNPKVRGSEEDELENLKYQIFKWINKLVGEDNTETIAHAQDLMKKIKSVPLPMRSNQKEVPFDPMRPCLNETGATCRKEKSKSKPKGPCCTNTYCPFSSRPTPRQEPPKHKPCCNSASCQYSPNPDVPNRKPCYTDVSTSVQSYPGHCLHSAQISQGGYVPQGSYGQDPNRNQGQVRTSIGQYGPQASYGLPNQNQSQFGQGAYVPQGPYSQGPNHSAFGPQVPFSQGLPGQNGQGPNQGQSQFSQVPQAPNSQDPRQGQFQYSQGPQGQNGQSLSQGQSQFNQGPQGQINQNPNQGQSQFNQGPQGQYGQDMSQGQSQFSQGTQAQYGQDPNQGQSQFSPDAYSSQSPYGLGPYQGQMANGQGAYGPQGSYGGQQPSPGYLPASGINGQSYGSPGQFPPGQNIQNGPYVQDGSVGPAGAGGFGPQIPNQQWDMSPTYQPVMNGPEGYYQGGPGGVPAQQGVPESRGRASIDMQGAQYSPPQGQIQYNQGYSIGAGLVNTGESCCRFQEHSVLSPSIKHLNDQYDGYLKDWVHRIPIAASNPEEQDAAEKTRLAFYTGIWKAITKLRLDPEIFSNPYYYQDQFEDEIDALFATVPKSKELDDAKDKLKTELIEKTVAVNNYIKTTNATASFKQQIVDSIEHNLPKRVSPVNLDEFIQQNEEVLKMELAENFILYMRYKDEDNLKANVYKKNFLRKLEQFLGIIKTDYGADLKQTNTFATDILNSLDKIPILNKSVLEDEADDILLSVEVENWISDLPLTTTDMGPLEKRRIRDAIAMKLQEVGKIVAYTDCIFSKPLKEELPKILERLPIQPGTNLDFMMEELSNRVKFLTRSTKPKSNKPNNYEDFAQNVLGFSSATGQETPNYIIGNVVQTSGSKIWPNFSLQRLPQERKLSKDQSEAAPTNFNWPNEEKTQADELNTLGKQPVIKKISGPTYLDTASGTVETYFISKIPSSGIQYNAQGTSVSEQTNVAGRASLVNKTNVQGNAPDRKVNFQETTSSGFQTNDLENSPSTLQINVQRTLSSGFKPYVQTSPSQVFQANVQGLPTLGMQPIVQGPPNSGIQSNVQGPPKLGMQPVAQGSPTLRIQPGVQGQPTIGTQSIAQGPPTIGFQPIVQRSPTLGTQPVQGYQPSAPQENLVAGFQANVQPGNKGAPFMVPCCINLSCPNRPRSLSPGVAPSTPISQVIPDIFKQNQGIGPVFPLVGPGEVTHARQYNQPPQDTYSQNNTGTNNQGQSLGLPLVPYGQITTNVPSTPAQQPFNPQGTYGPIRPIAYNPPSGINPVLPVEPNSYAQNNQPVSYSPISTDGQVKARPSKMITAGQNNRAPQRANDPSNFATSKRSHSNIPIPISRGKVQDSRQTAPVARYSKLPQDQYSQSRSFPGNPVQYGNPPSAPGGQGKDGQRLKSLKNTVPDNKGSPNNLGKVNPNYQLPNSAQTNLGPQGTYNQINSVPYTQPQNIGPASTNGGQDKVSPIDLPSNLPGINFAPQEQRISFPINQDQSPGSVSKSTGPLTVGPTGQTANAPRISFAPQDQRYSVPLKQDQSSSLESEPAGPIAGPSGQRMNAPRISFAPVHQKYSFQLNPEQSLSLAPGPTGPTAGTSGQTTNKPAITQGPQDNYGLPSASQGPGNLEAAGQAPNETRMTPVAQGQMNTEPYNQAQNVEPLLPSTEQGNLDPRYSIASRYSIGPQKKNATTTLPRISFAPQLRVPNSSTYNQASENDPEANSTDQVSIEPGEKFIYEARDSVWAQGQRYSVPFDPRVPGKGNVLAKYQRQSVPNDQGQENQSAVGPNGQANFATGPTTNAPQISQVREEPHDQSNNTPYEPPREDAGFPSTSADQGKEDSKPYNQTQEIGPLSVSPEQVGAGPSGQSPNVPQISVASQAQSNSVPNKQDQDTGTEPARANEGYFGPSQQSPNGALSTSTQQSGAGPSEQSPNVPPTSGAAQNQPNIQPYSQGLDVGTSPGPIGQDFAGPNGQSQNGTTNSQNLQSPYTETGSDPYRQDQGTSAQGQPEQEKQDSPLAYQNQPSTSAGNTMTRSSQHMARMSPEDVANYNQDPRRFFEEPLPSDKAADTRRVSFHSSLFNPGEQKDKSEPAQPVIRMPEQQQQPIQCPRYLMAIEYKGPDASKPSLPENPCCRQVPVCAIGVQATIEMPGPCLQSACPTQTQPFMMCGPRPNCGTSTNPCNKPGFFKSTDSEGIKQVIDQNKNNQESSTKNGASSSNGLGMCCPRSQQRCLIAEKPMKKSRNPEKHYMAVKKRMEMTETETDTEKDKEIKCRCMKRPRRCRGRRTTINDYHLDYPPCYQIVRYPCYY